FEAYPNSYAGDYYGSESFDYTTEEGLYYGSYDFRDEAGKQGLDIDFVESYSASDNCDISIVGEFDGHKNVLQLRDDNDEGTTAMSQVFTEEIDSTIEFWLGSSWNPDYYYRNCYINLYDESTYIVRLVLTGGAFRLNTHDAVDVTIDTFEPDKLYHISLVFNDTYDCVDIYVNGELKWNNADFYNGASSTDGVDKIYISTRSYNSGYRVYLDAFGFSADTTSHNGLGYSEGWNINPYDLLPLWENNFINDERNCPILPIGSSLNVIDQLNDHYNVLNITKTGKSDYVKLYLNDSSQTSGTCEFWWQCNDTTEYLHFTTYTDLWAIGAQILFGQNNKIRADNSGSYVDVCSINPNIWYHISIKFESGSGNYDGLSADTYNIYINGTKYGPYSFNTAGGSLDFWKFTIDNTIGTVSHYLDAIGQSWDTNYDVGDNCNPYGKIEAMENNGWTIVYKPHTSYCIIDELDGHNKVLKLVDNDAEINGINIYQDFSSQSSGIAEFWFREDSEGINDKYWIRLKDGGSDAVLLRYYAGYFYYYNSTGAIHTICAINNDQWYHMSVHFDCTTDLFDFYVDGQLQGSGGFEFNHARDQISRFQIDSSSYQAYDNAIVYLDALGIVGVNDYEAGMNQYSQGSVTSVNPDDDSISFIIDDISPIVDYSLNAGIDGYWEVFGDTYTFHFNDTSISEGLTLVEFTCEDSLGYTTTIEFTLLLDRSAPSFVEVSFINQIENNLFEIIATLDDISKYFLSLECTNAGMVTSSVEYSLIPISANEWQIILDTTSLSDGYNTIILTASDTVGNFDTYTLLNVYIDNVCPVLDSFEDQIYVDGENIYNTTITDTLYFSEEKYLKVIASDVVYDDFEWDLIDPRLGDRQGVQGITFFYTNPLTWYNISIKGSLSYEQLTYEIDGYGTSTLIQNIRSIQSIRIGDYIIDKFTILLEGTSLLLQIDAQYRYALSPSLTGEIYAQFYELVDDEIELEFNTITNKWELLSTGSYFNISEYLN
ncbi:MAG: hypothetical protein ACFFCI_24605, partial [Promethearchaeota archaeon]